MARSTASDSELRLWSILNDGLQLIIVGIVTDDMCARFPWTSCRTVAGDVWAGLYCDKHLWRTSPEDNDSESSWPELEGSCLLQGYHNLRDINFNWNYNRHRRRETADACLLNLQFEHRASRRHMSKLSQLRDLPPLLAPRLSSSACPASQGSTWILSYFLLEQSGLLSWHRTSPCLLQQNQAPGT